MTEIKKSNFENINELLKAILWPIVVISVLLFYHSEISEMFRSSSKVSLGSFSMEMQREANNKGSADLSNVISELSIPGIKKLLSMGASGSFGIVGQRRGYEEQESGYNLTADLSTWEELEKANLVIGENFRISDLVNLFKSLKAQETTVYYNDQGYSTTIKDDTYPYEGKEYFLPESKLNKDLKQKLENYTITLTENGRKALDIIVETTAKQIKK